MGGFDPNLGMVQVGQQIKSLYNGDHKNFAPEIGHCLGYFGQGNYRDPRRGGIIFNSLLPMQTFTGLAGNAVNVSGGVATVPTGAALIRVVHEPGKCRIRLRTGHWHDCRRECRNPAVRRLDRWHRTGRITVPACLFSPEPTQSSVATAVDGEPADSPCSLAVIDHNFRTPYVTNWTLGVQHALTNDLSMDISYVGNHGSRLNGIRDINQDRWVQVFLARAF